VFHPSYIKFVLDRNFEDAKALLLEPLLAIHRAHLVMLAGQGIVSAADARVLRDALQRVSIAEVRAVRYDGTCEDLFFFVDRLIAEACGPEIAGRLHTARSRNDIDMTMYRMLQREMLLRLDAALGDLRRALLDQAAAHRDTIFAAHTHTQPAQPTTVAHYLLAVIEQLERDAVRLRAAYASTNRNPLGACAITGTGFPIDRARTTALLGFESATGNTYGSIATVDYLLESVAATAVMLTGLGRVIQDLLLWCTAEVGYLRLGEGFVQTSSIMPQKRNPVALEHARSLASLALGQTQTILLAAHNTPFGDIVDTEDDLQPIVAGMFADAVRAVGLVAAAMASASFNRDRMAARAGAAGVTTTELADSLTRLYDVPFRTSHQIAASFFREPGASQPAARLRELVAGATGREIEITEAQLAAILSPEYFVGVRTTPGGPAPAETMRAVAASEACLANDEAWREGAVKALRDPETELNRAVDAL
jgi:argininosuccinate lyase